jgi:prefoldin subunit 5
MGIEEIKEEIRITKEKITEFGEVIESFEKAIERVERAESLEELEGMWIYAGWEGIHKKYYVLEKFEAWGEEGYSLVLTIPMGHYTIHEGDSYIVNDIEELECILEDIKEEYCEQKRELEKELEFLEELKEELESFEEGLDKGLGSPSYRP